MLKGYFGSDSYDTPVSEKPSLSERFLLDNRLYFACKYLGIVFRTRSEARKGIYDKKAWTDSSLEIMRLLERTGALFHITGMENIVKSPEPVLFISNHMSTLETMILPCIISPLREVTFVVKDSLVKHPLFGDVMRSRNPIVVGRNDPRKDFEIVMNEGQKLLSNGTSIIIFPQSTRSSEFKPEEFNSMGVKLAKKSGVKIVPVAIRTDFWGNGKVIKEFGPLNHKNEVHFRFGEPMNISGNGKDEHLAVINFILSSLEQWYK
jgi:1-acyl-sn-glycerol-3-phosphate acyltransferase